MHLQNIRLNNFKNYQQSAVDFSPKLNLIVGQNGAGKTNLLDAIYYLCFCKSYFTNSDRHNIRHEQSFYRLDGSFILHGVEEQITCKFAKSRRKEFSRNETVYSKLSEHIGLLPLVMIAPDDIILIKGGSEERRKLIDSTLAQLNKQYLTALIQYNKILQQRNAALKQFALMGYKTNHSLLETYNQQIIPNGNFIHIERQKFIAELLPIFQHYYELISSGKEQVGINYISPLNNHSFVDILQKNVAQDCQLQRTSEGIHRDNLQFSIDTYPVKKFGSQGQQKSFLLALKLAIYQFIKRYKQSSPILLLDDIFDKLDELRTQQLVNTVSSKDFGQIFISDTQAKRMQTIFDTFDLSYKLFLIKDDVISS